MMVGQKRIESIADPNGQWLYFTGGATALVLGIAYIAIMALYIPIGAPPIGAEARLAYVGAHRETWGWILGLSVLTDLLFIPLAWALYQALETVDRAAMRLATAFVGLFVVLDLAITWTTYAALIGLSSTLTSATSEAQRMAITAAAYLPTAVLESSLLFVYNSLTLAVGIFITGLVMRRSQFGKLTAFLGLATGACGMIAVVGSFFVTVLGGLIILASLLTTVWALLVGWQFLRLARA